MLFVYSLELETLTLKLHDFSSNHKEAADLLNRIAINFIRTECGDRRAEEAFKDNVKDSDITEDGYFLRHSEETTNRIDVYHRKTFISTGLWTSVKYEIKKVKFYSITEASMNMPIENSQPVRKPVFDNEKLVSLNDNLMKELKEKLFPNTKVNPSNIKNIPPIRNTVL